MVPERFEAVRRGMNDLAVEIETLSDKLGRRDRWTRVLRTAMVVALLFIGWAILQDRMDDAALERERFERCVDTRTDLVAMANATANGSADGLQAIADANPDLQEPAAKAQAARFIAAYRARYVASLVAVAPKPEDCK